MSRIRTIKPEFFIHDELQDLEVVHPGKYIMLVFAGLWTLCDSKGKFEYKPRHIKLKILPFIDFDINETLMILEESGFIFSYQVNGKSYGKVVSFNEHQRITGKEATDGEKHPDPAEDRPSPEKGNNWETTGKHPVAQEREREREKELNKTIVEKIRPVADTKADPSDVMEIFEHWKQCMGHPSAKLSDERRAIIRKALGWKYTAEQLKNAISGCSITPHNIGDNDRGQRYDGLKIIFRNADNIDRFIKNFHSPPRAKSKAEQRTQQNLTAAQRWLEKSMMEGSNEEQ